MSNRSTSILNFGHCFLAVLGVNAHRPSGLGAFGHHGDSNDKWACHAPANSSWNWDEKTLIAKTKNIFLAVATRGDKTEVAKTIAPDFHEHTYAMDCKGPNGRIVACKIEKTKWRFKVVRDMKGKIFDNSKTFIVAIKAGVANKKILPTIQQLCSHSLVMRI